MFRRVPFQKQDVNRDRWHLVCRLRYQFLASPVEKLGDKNFVFAGAGAFVNPAELAKLLAGFAGHSENLAIEAQLVDAPGESVGGTADMIWPGRDADGAGRGRGHR